MTTLETRFERLKKAIFLKRPVLEEILAKSGDSSLLEYASTFSRNARKPDENLQEECISVIKNHTENILGSVVAESVTRQLRANYYVSTTDHLGPISHPFFVHADLLAAAPYVENPRADHENLIVLACSNVSLGNSSFPRSHLFHASDYPPDEYLRLNFFPAIDRGAPVFRFRPYSREDLARAFSSLSDRLHVKKLPHALLTKVRDLLSVIYGASQSLNRASYAEQITLTNDLLWQRFFSRSSIRLPRLIYLELESIVARLLSQHHMENNTAIHELLFNPEVLKKSESLFDTIPGAFSLEKRLGTFLFWFLPAGGTARVALWREEDMLVSEDEQYSIPLDPAEIRRLLEARQLIPNTMLSLIVLSCYYGLKCLGGFSQVNYLTRIDEAYGKIFPESVSARSAGDSFTKSLCGDFVIGLLRYANTEELVPATGLDFVLYNQPDSWDLFLETTKIMTLTESFGLMFPELYRILYTEEERDADLDSLTRSDIMNLFQTIERINPCLTIPCP